jgi:transposase
VIASGTAAPRLAGARARPPARPPGWPERPTTSASTAPCTSRAFGPGAPRIRATAWAGFGRPGSSGGLTIVKDYVHRIRLRRQPAFLKLDFEPGECAQVDWGELGSVAVGNTRWRLSFFVMVLCCSQRMVLEFTVSQEVEFFLACHENAFAAFGAVPARLMVDNLKSAVLKRLVGQAPVFNPLQRRVHRPHPGGSTAHRRRARRPAAHPQC